MIQELGMLKIFLKAEVFLIPSQFPSLRNVNPKVLSVLNEKQEYDITSKVDKNIVQCFINYWINHEIPIINSDNISKYEEISKEFYLMKNIIKVYKNKLQKCKNNKLIAISIEKSNKFKDLSNTVKKNENLHQEIIKILFNSTGIDKYSKFLKVKKDLLKACNNFNVEIVDLLTCKKVKQDGLLYVINEKQKTAGLFRLIKSKKEIFLLT